MSTRRRDSVEAVARRICAAIGNQTYAQHGNSPCLYCPHIIRGLRRERRRAVRLAVQRTPHHRIGCLCLTCETIRDTAAAILGPARPRRRGR